MCIVCLPPDLDKKKCLCFSLPVFTPLSRHCAFCSYPPIIPSQVDLHVYKLHLEIDTLSHILWSPCRGIKLSTSSVPCSLNSLNAVRKRQLRESEKSFTTASILRGPPALHSFYNRKLIRDFFFFFAFSNLFPSSSHSIQKALKEDRGPLWHGQIRLILSVNLSCESAA